MVCSCVRGERRVVWQNGPKGAEILVRGWIGGICTVCFEAWCLL